MFFDFWMFICKFLDKMEDFENSDLNIFIIGTLIDF